jgi:colicin import membrane protein
MNSGNQDLIQVQNSVSAMEKIETGLAQMRDRFVGRVYDVATAPGMTLAKADRAEVREVRFEVERARKAGKAPLLALGKWADQTAARITAEILKIETPIDAVVKAEEDRIAAEKQARIDAEILRVQTIQKRISDIRDAPLSCAAANQAVILERIADIEGRIIDSSFAEFEQEAYKTKAATVASLRGLHAAAVARELEDERIAAERVELEKLRAAQAERDRADKAKRDEEERIAAETRRAEAARVAGEQRAQREAFEKEQREARERQAAEDRRIAEDRQKLEDERKRLQPPPARKRVHNPGSEAICEAVAHFFSVDKTLA